MFEWLYWPQLWDGLNMDSKYWQLWFAKQSIISGKCGPLVQVLGDSSNGTTASLLSASRSNYQARRAQKHFVKVEWERQPVYPHHRYKLGGKQCTRIWWLPLKELAASAALRAASSVTIPDEQCNRSCLIPKLAVWNLKHQNAEPPLLVQYFERRLWPKESLSGGCDNEIRRCRPGIGLEKL